MDTFKQFEESLEWYDAEVLTTGSKKAWWPATGALELDSKYPMADTLEASVILQYGAVADGHFLKVINTPAAKSSNFYASQLLVSFIWKPSICDQVLILLHAEHAVECRWLQSLNCRIQVQVPA